MYVCVCVCLQLGYTCLHQAAQQGQLAVINLLLKYEASPNAVTHVRFTWSFYTNPRVLFIFIHYKGSDKNNNNTKEKQNNLTKQRNRVTCKFLNEFLILFYQQYTRKLTTKHSVLFLY